MYDLDDLFLLPDLLEYVRRDTLLPCCLAA